MPIAPEITSANIVARHCIPKDMRRATIAISTDTTEPVNKSSESTLSILTISGSPKNSAVNGAVTNISM